MVEGVQQGPVLVGTFFSAFALPVTSICQKPERLSSLVLYFVLAARSMACSRFGMLPECLLSLLFSLA